MTDLVSRIGKRKSKIEWENPKECTGEKQGEIQSGKYACWRPIGRAKDAWNDLWPKIKEFLDHFGSSSLTLVMLEMYMIGRTDETASPIILICSEDNTRKRLRKAIKDSGILIGYCGIGLGDTPVLLDRRRIQPMMDLTTEEFASQRFFDKLKSEPGESQLTHSGHRKVLGNRDEERIIGRRLIFPCADGQRYATGGPIIYIQDKAYQLTVGHASADVAGVLRSGTENDLNDECDFDGQSDSDETGGSLLDLYATSCASQSPEPLFVTDSDSEGESLIAEASNSTSLPVHKKVVEVGNMSLNSEDGPFPSLDYALIEIEVPSPLSCMITFGNGDSKTSVEIKRESEIGPVDAAILAITASGGVLTGRLSPLASVMRPAGKTTFQEVYPVELDGQVKMGDCGSAVIDRSTGQFYGHITAGTPGTGFAYIIPAVDVLKDLEGRSVGYNSESRKSADPTVIGTWPNFMARFSRVGIAS
ncbi:hypothetical protein DL770_004290 [Monosporascus sp. CRB-9-2]|nr:hypothetical protein DL770_004290 [Monosporascus sp. CRB-9-2]